MPTRATGFRGLGADPRHLADRRTCELGESCALQSLTNEVARSEPKTYMADEAELQRTVEELASGMAAGSARCDRAKAIALLATLSGGVSMARPVNDPDFADEIISALRAAMVLHRRRNRGIGCQLRSGDAGRRSWMNEESKRWTGSERVQKEADRVPAIRPSRGAPERLQPMCGARRATWDR